MFESLKDMNRITAHATLVGHDITLEATQEVLHDSRAYDRRITVEKFSGKLQTTIKLGWATCIRHEDREQLPDRDK